jgi:hypothetical protein
MRHFGETNPAKGMSNPAGFRYNIFIMNNDEPFLPPLSDPDFPYGEYQELLGKKKYKEAKAVLLELKQGGLISTKDYTLHHQEVLALMKAKKKN